MVRIFIALFSVAVAGCAYDPVKGDFTDWGKEQYANKHIEKMKVEALTYLRERYPLNEVFYIGRSATEFKNGNPVSVTAQEVKSVSVFSAQGATVSAKVCVKQEVKTDCINTLIFFSIDGDNQKVKSDNLQISGEQVLLREDPLIKFRKQKSVIEAINARSIYVGMPEDALVLSWGPPKKINEFDYGSGLRRQYVYYGNQFVYVEARKVTSWQKF